MENTSGDKKINRRRTRNKTQVIQFDLSELETLREDIKDKQVSTPNLSHMSINTFLNTDQTYNNNEETHGIRNRRNSLPSASEIQAQRDQATQRMFNFTEISNYFKKIEKRELFPRSKHDYIYKKSKGIESNEDRDLLEERNLIHMRIEEELIPYLNNNPFIQNDRRCRK